MPAPSWSDSHGWPAINAFGFDWGVRDGFDDAGLSLGTLWFPETDLPEVPPARRPP